MMRPSDWYLVDLDADPTPGDPAGIRQLAQKYADIAYTAAHAATIVRGMRSSHETLAWVGDAGTVFRSETDRMPGELSKADHSYSLVASALTAWADALDDAQAQADRGLAQARDAHADLVSAQAALGSAQRSWTTAHAQQLSQQKLQKQYHDVPPPSGVTMPTDAQLRATGRSAAQAQTSMDAATAQISSANARIDAAKRLVLEAKASRDEAESATVRTIGDAQDRAVKPSSVWEAIGDSAAWQALVTVATVVLTIVSVVALFVGGPLVWAIILAASAILIADALMKLAQGNGDGWGELALTLVGLIPGGRFLTLGGRLLGTVARAGETGARVAGAVDKATTAVLRATRLRPANVAVSHVPRSTLPEGLVGRGGLEALSRGDGRPPEQIFETGFDSWNTTETRYSHFVETNAKSVYVSTTRDPSVMFGEPGARYGYSIDAPGGIDANATLGDHRFSWEHEISFPGGIRTEFIEGVRPMLPDGTLGELVPNPNFVPQIPLVRMLGWG